MVRTVLRMLDEAAVRWGDLPYALKKIEERYVPVSFAQAHLRSRRFAAWLINAGYEKGDAIAILAEGSPEWIIGEFGVLAASCVSVPLSIKLLQEEIPFRLNHSEAKAILTTKNQLEKVLGSFTEVVDKRIALVYLDDDPDYARMTAAKYGIGPDRIIGFEEALALGQALLADTGSGIGSRLEALLAAIEENDTVTICYTSGTTGNPKGIMLTHLNYWTNCHDGVELFQMPSGFKTLVILPVDHSFAHTAGLYIALLIGMTLYFVDSRGGGIATLRNIPINLKESEPTFLMTVPALSGNFMKKIISGIEEKGGLIERLFKAGIASGIAYIGDGFNKPPLTVRARSFFPYMLAKAVIFKKVKRMIFGKNILYCVGGGALLDVKQQEFYAAFGLPIYQGYGLTEAAPIISSNSPVCHKFGTSGRICSSIECKLVKPDGTLAKVGENAEIVIRGGNVMKGYFKNPEASAACLRDGWLYTGDLAHWDEDGFLVVVGREKALLIAEDGEKYSPEEIEEAVQSSTEVFDQVMVWCEQKKYVTALVTVDVAKVEKIIAAKNFTDAAALLDFLKEEFYRFRSNPKAKKVQTAWVPSVFQIVPAAFGEKDGTVNSTMKIVRHRISSLYRELIDYSYSPEGSKPANQKNLATLRSLFKLR